MEKYEVKLLTASNQKNIVSTAKKKRKCHWLRVVNRLKAWVGREDFQI